MSYVPNELANVESTEQVRLWALEELRRISREFAETTALELRPSTTEPIRPREGIIVYADGTSWNPGSGEGLYVYKNGAWVKIGEGVREVLTANRTYYVRTDGSDSNTGLVDSSGGAFLTIQKAIDVAVARDLSIYAITIDVGNGTYTGIIVLKPYLGTGPITITGDTTTPTNVVISPTSASCFTAAGLFTRYVLQGMQLDPQTSGFNCISATQGSRITFNNINFASATSGTHISANLQSEILANGNYSISGGAAQHWSSNSGSVIQAAGITVTLTGTPAFSIAFAMAQRTSGLVVNGNTFSGSATGPRYSVVSNGYIDTAGGGATYLPGDSAGSAATGGQYL